MIRGSIELPNSTSKARVVCDSSYFRTISYLEDYNTFEYIPADLCTHLICTTIEIDDKTWQVVHNNKSYEIEQEDLTDLKRTHPKLKLIVGIYNWAESGERYSNMVAVKERRSIFIASIIGNFVNILL